ncbi:hypothetical protein Tco_0683613 [Tanacetum coccineum]
MAHTVYYIPRINVFSLLIQVQRNTVMTGHKRATLLSDKRDSNETPSLLALLVIILDHLKTALKMLDEGDFLRECNIERLQENGVTVPANSLHPEVINTNPARNDGKQKSYADRRRKALEFEDGDKVMLKVSPCKGVIRFGKRGKLNPRYIRPFKILAKKCFVDEPLAIPLDEIQIDDKLHFIEEPVEIMDREVKRLK